MSTPLTFPQLPNPPQLNGFPFFTPPTQQSSPFSSNQTNQLQALANGLNNFNPTLVTSAATDIFNAEQTLLSQNTTFQALIANISQLTTNPNAFISSIFSKEVLDTSALGIPSQLYAALGTPGVNPQPFVPTQTVSSSTLHASSGINIWKNTNAAQLATSNLTQATSFNPAGYTIALPAQIRPFLNALLGENPSGINTPALDFWNATQGLYNFWLNFLQNTSSSSTSSSSILTNLLNAFNVGGLSSGTLNSNSVPYLMPVTNGSTFTQFVQGLITMVTSPGNVVAEVLMTPPVGAPNAPSNASQISVASAMSTFLTAQAPGNTGMLGQQYVEPFVNTLFGVSPTTSNPTDPFQSLYNIVISPNTFLTNLFPTNNIGTTSVNPKKFITDLLNPNSSGVAGDLTSLTSYVLPGAFNNILSPTSPWASGSISPQQVITDLINNPINVPCDILSLTNIGQYTGVSIPNSTVNVTSLCSMINGMFQNFLNVAKNLFTGQGTQSGFSFLPAGGGGNSISYGNNSNGTGWQSSSLPRQFFGINGVIQGDLGYSMMIAATAFQEMFDAWSAITASNPVTAIFTASSTAEHVLNSIYLNARATMMMIAQMTQLFSLVSNIAGVLNNSGIPTGPSTNWGSLGISPNGLSTLIGNAGNAPIPSGGI